MGQRRASTRVRTYSRALGPDEHERDEVLLEFGQKLKASRRAANLTQERLAVRCFMRRDEISGYERGTRLPSLIALLALESRLGAPRGLLTDGLVAPMRRAGTARMFELVVRRPGLSSAAAAEALTLPSWYTLELALYLQSTGAIVSARGGWWPEDERLPRRAEI
jgi:transcriptional regulator with XRE-family HTH domain